MSVAHAESNHLTARSFSSTTFAARCRTLLHFHPPPTYIASPNHFPHPRLLLQLPCQAQICKLQLVACISRIRTDTRADMHPRTHIHASMPRFEVLTPSSRLSSNKYNKRKCHCNTCTQDDMQAHYVLMGTTELPTIQEKEINLAKNETHHLRKPPFTILEKCLPIGPLPIR